MARFANYCKGLVKGIAGTTTFVFAANTLPLDVELDDGPGGDLGYASAIIAADKGHSRMRHIMSMARNDSSDKEKDNQATVNLLLIRNGQNEGDALTSKGHNQISSAGQRLFELDFPKTHYFTRIYNDPSNQSFQTANIISGYLPEVRMETDLDIPTEERPEGHLEAAFKKYVRRAHQNQKGDAYQVVVCDADFIRYTVNRSMPLHPSFWEQFDLKHGSLTMISVLPNGDVKLRCLGDAGHHAKNL